MEKINRLLNIEKGEEAKIFILIFQSFFLGIFLATYDISASALFKKAFPDPVLLDWSFVISGSLGLLFSFIYIRLQSRVRFSTLSIFNLIIITAITFLSRLSYEFSDSEWLSFIVYALMGPLNALAIVGFSGVAGRLFNLRQGKRLFGLIDSGQTFGIIIISFLVPFILNLVENKDLLYISAASLFVSLIFQISLVKRYGKEISIRKSRKRVDQSVPYTELFRNKYYSKITLFVIVSTVAAFFIYRLFMDVSYESYPEESDLASFFAVFFGVVNIFSFLLQAFLFSRLTNMYGIKVSLMLMPIVVGLFVVGSSVIGSFMGYHPGSENFILFFLMISLSRLFSVSLRNAIEKPAQKILYQPIDSGVRYDVQAKIDGFVNEFSSIIAGIILLVIYYLGLPGIYTAYATIAMLVVLAFVIYRLYTQYQATLRESLTFAKVTLKETTFLTNSQALDEGISSPIPDKVIYTLKLAERLEPIAYERLVVELLNDASPKVREYVLDRILEMRLYGTIEMLQKRLEVEDSASLLDKTSDVLERLYLSQEESMTYEHIELLVGSRDREKRAYAAKVLGQIVTEETLPLLTDLIRDIEPKVRLQAIKSAAKVHRPELWPFLTDNLSNPIYQSAATSSLVAIGVDVLDALERSFYKSGATTESLSRLVKIMGAIGGDKAIELLLAKITFPDTQVVKQVLLSLHKCGFQSSESSFSRVFQALETNIGNILWNMAAIEEIPEGTAAYLKTALEEENQDNFETLYLLLALAYEPSSIEKIKENIETGTSESIGYAVELLELFVAEELKVILFPVLEDIPVNDKIRQLQNYYPRFPLTPVELMIQIINRDYNNISKWTKACAIAAYGQMEGVKVNDDLIANLFNPDPLMREATAVVVYGIDPEAYHEAGKRIASKVKRELDYLVTGSKERKIQQLVQKTIFLKELPSLSQLKWTILVDLARELELQYCQSDECLLEKATISSVGLYIVVEGEVRLQSKGNVLETFGPGSIVGEMLFLDGDDSQTELVTTTPAKVFSMSKENLFELLYRYNELTHIIIDAINPRFDISNEEVTVKAEPIN